MVGRPSDAPDATTGQGTARRNEPASEQDADAWATDMSVQLARANQDLAALRAEIGRLHQSHTEALARAWVKIETERTRATAAVVAETKMRATAERLVREAAAHTDAMKVLRAKLKTERLRVSVRQERLGQETARARALDATAASLRQDIEALSARLAEATAAGRRNSAEQALQASGNPGEIDGDEAAGRIVDGLAASSGAGAADDPAGYFRLGRMLQLQGAFELAAAAYRKAGPRITEFLAQPGPDGAPITGPEFLIIGAARAGTTWLKRALSHHPAIFMMAGEPQFFSMTPALGPDAYVSRFAATDARFLRRFHKERSPVRPEGSFHGEKSTTYLTMPDSQINLCAALYPKAKIICLVREPIGRVWSSVKHEGLGHLGERPNRLNDQPYWSSLDHVIRQGRYEDHLARWARRYPPDQILLVDFARVASDAANVYREVLEHIGADPTIEAPIAERVNGSSESEVPAKLKEILDAAYAGDRWDLPWLRQVMEQAAAGKDVSQGAPAPASVAVPLRPLMS